MRGQRGLQAREKARQAVCLSNIKQIGLGQMMYIQDYDEHLVTSWAKGFVGDYNFNIQPYLKNLDVLICPSKKISTAAVAGVCTASDGYDDFIVPRDNPTNEPYLWGYGFNNGVTWVDGTGLIDGVSNPLGGTVVTIIVGGNDANRVSLGGGTGTVTIAGSGSERITASATGAYNITLGDGNETVGLAGGNSTVIAGNGNDVVASTKNSV